MLSKLIEESGKTQQLTSRWLDRTIKPQPNPSEDTRQKPARQVAKDQLHNPEHWKPTPQRT